MGTKLLWNLCENHAARLRNEGGKLGSAPHDADKAALKPDETNNARKNVTARNVRASARRHTAAYGAYSVTGDNRGALVHLCHNGIKGVEKQASFSSQI